MAQKFSTMIIFKIQIQENVQIFNDCEKILNYSIPFNSHSVNNVYLTGSMALSFCPVIGI